jgi:NAD(P)-dependent dehydrogenase (short-subunit alcohol dehydrogenase family)
MDEDMRLADKVALVAGGDRGIGRGIAIELGREGADVALTTFATADGANEVVAELQQLGRRAMAIPADLTRTANAGHAVAATVEAMGRLDLLVFNSGVHTPHPFLEMTQEIYDATLDLNLRGAFFCVQEAARAMIAQGISGSIVTISSTQSYLSMAGHSHYAASKAGMNQFVRTVANELGPYGINVNAIAPGHIKTPDRAKEIPNYNPERWAPTVPLGRIGTPQDVARAVVFLASSDADYITGTVTVIDGGIITRSPHYDPEGTLTYPNLRGKR